MDNAVALVQAYLHVNGYFTVAEYPVLESLRHGGYRSITDLDILAFRFAGAGRPMPRKRGKPAIQLDQEAYGPDPVLGVVSDQTDMLIGEVKEGSAELNPGISDPITMKVALARFGCCTPSEADAVARTLLKRGHVTLSSGHDLRMVAFGSVNESNAKPYLKISLGHVLSFLQDYIREHWEFVRHAQFKDPVFGFLVTLEKAMQGGNGR